MKHAILILAHKNINQLFRLIKYFSRNCDVFIHIDKKQDFGVEEENNLYTYQQVKFISREYNVNWGGTSVLESEMHLLRVAVQRSDADYFHLISGQDYPVRPLEYFLDFFERDAGKEYIGYVHLPHPKWEGNTFHRLQYYYPYDYATRQENPKEWVKEQVRQQRCKGIKRPIPDEFDHLYGSSQWFSITRKAATTLLNYTDSSPSLYRKMWMTFAPEECYVATVLVNLINHNNIVPWNHRFIRWKYENGNRPANLGCEHFRYLLENEYLMARKIDLPVSSQLVGWIDQYLHQDCIIKYKMTGGWIYNGFIKYNYDKKFANFVSHMWCEVAARTGVDMGCGAGSYVAHWRSCGMSFAGYDANPYTKDLSAMLLPEGDVPCGVADLTDELVAENKFDIVVCKDVLPYIPQKLEQIAVRNLAKLSARFIVLSWNVPKALSIPPIRMVKEDSLLALFKNEKFKLIKYLTENLRVILNRKDCCVLEKYI